MSNVVLQPGDQRPLLTPERLLAYMRDLPGFNETMEQELTPKEVAEAISEALMEFNMWLPIMTAFTAFDFPDYVLLRDLATDHCLNRLVIWHGRNYNTANDAGVQINVHENVALVDGFRQANRASAERKMINWKVFYNINGGWGGVGSPLRGW